MITLIVLLKNQSQYIPRLIRAINEQTVAPDRVIFAVDRCPEDYHIIQSLELSPSWSTVLANENDDQSTILIGKTRDAALRMCEGSHVIFTDGDCVPSPCFVSAHKAWLEKPYMVATTGVRKSEDENGQWSDDIRQTALPYKDCTFKTGKDRAILGSAGESTMVLFGCNMGLNSAAIKYLRERHTEELGDDRVFPALFDGKWGFEDTAIGPVLYNAGCLLVALDPKTSRVDHAYHPTRKADIKDQARQADEYIKKTSQCLISVTRSATGASCKKRTSDWILSCLHLENEPQWFNSILGHLSSVERAQLAAVAYRQIRDSLVEEPQPTCDIPKMQSIISSAMNGIDLVCNEEHKMVKVSLFGDSPKDAANVSIVIPMHNQAHNVDAIMQALSAQTMRPKEIIIVADRCVDATVARVMSCIKDVQTQVKIVHKEGSEEGFWAGQTRNVGIEEATGIGVLLLDGDCVPAETWLEAHVTALAKAHGPTVTFGLRKDQTHAGSEEFRPDTRTYRSSVPIFWKDTDAVVVSREPVFNHMATWSCNLGLNRVAIDLLKGLNDGHVFSPNLTTGVWGGEDTYLGIQVWDNNGTLVAINPERGHVKHIWHTRQGTSNLGAVSKLRHSRSAVSVFERGGPELANSVENNLIRAVSAKNIHGMYRKFEKIAFKEGVDRGLTERALAFWCSRNTAFSDAPVQTTLVTHQDMWVELLRVKSIITGSGPVGVGEASFYTERPVNLVFSELTPRGVICKSCKTVVVPKENNRCPMCRSLIE